MKLIDALKAAANAEVVHSASIDDLHEWLFDAYHMDFDDEGFGEVVTERYIKSWMCTDTLVGFAALYFEDRPIGFSWQSARKSEKVYRFISEANKEELKAFILSLKIVTPLDNHDILTEAQLEGEVAETIPAMG